MIEKLNALVEGMTTDSNYTEIKASPSIPIPTTRVIRLSLTIVLESVESITPSKCVLISLDWTGYVRLSTAA